jgi:hypothetical protein
MVADFERRADGRPVTRTLTLVMAAVAGISWAGALALLLFGDALAQRDVFAPARVIFYALIVAAALLTFVPMQLRLETPGLALEGTLGAVLLFYTLAFVPAPTSWLLSPPDAPVYALLAVAVYLFGAAAALPIVATVGLRLLRQRVLRYDRRRMRRQAHEVGVVLALCVVLAGLRVLTPLGVLLLVLIVIVAELMFLSFVDAEM